MPNEISWSREGKDQKSDQPQTHGKSFNVIRQGAVLNDLQQRRVDEQAYEQERVRKGKMLALTDTDGKDEKPTTGDGQPTEKIILSDKPTPGKPGLLGGGDTYRDMDRFLHRTIGSDLRGGIGTELGRDLRDLYQLGGVICDAATRRAETRKAGKYHEEFYRDLDDIAKKCHKLDALNFIDFKSQFPQYAGYNELFDQQKGLFRKDYERANVVMGKLGLEGWHNMKKYDKSRERNFRDLSSGGKAIYVAQWFTDGQKGRSDKQRQKEFSQALGELDKKYRQLNFLTFDDFKSQFPQYADDNDLFNQQKESFIEYYDRQFDIVHKLGSKGWQSMKRDEKRRMRKSGQGASTSGG